MKPGAAKLVDVATLPSWTYKGTYDDARHASVYEEAFALAARRHSGFADAHLDCDLAWVYPWRQTEVWRPDGPAAQNKPNEPWPAKLIAHVRSARR